MYMTIRELADAVGVSTTTVLRFCRKLKCEGYSEFRVRFKLYLEQNEPQQANFGASEIISFFKGVNNDEFDNLLDQAVDIILSSERIIFVGAGTSGALAKYGARFFSNVGKFSNHIDDPYFPVMTWPETRWRSCFLFPVKQKRSCALPASSACITVRFCLSPVMNIRGWPNWLTLISPGTFHRRALPGYTI